MDYFYQNYGAYNIKKVKNSKFKHKLHVFRLEFDEEHESELYFSQTTFSVSKKFNICIIAYHKYIRKYAKDAKNQNSKTLNTCF